jgi:hypothetical protein
MLKTNAYLVILVVVMSRAFERSPDFINIGLQAGVLPYRCAEPFQRLWFWHLSAGKLLKTAHARAVRVSTWLKGAVNKI